MILRFADGMRFDTGGELRVVHESDGYYVIGSGMMIPVTTRKEGEKTIQEMAQKKGK